MIDRAHPLLPFTYPWYKFSTLAALAVLVVLFVLALVCIVAGVLLYVGSVVVVILAYLFFYLFAFLPLLAAIGIGVAVAANSKQSDQTPAVILGGILSVVAILIMWPAGWWGWTTSFPGPIAGAVMPWAGRAWDACTTGAGALCNAFVEYRVYLISLGIVAGAVGVAGATAGLIGIAHLTNLSERWFLKRYIQCPRCASSTPLILCPGAGCDVAHDDLSPSRYGIWAAKCKKCGANAPTTKAGQRKLRKVCSVCKCDLQHPDLGALPEFHIAVVGAKNSGKTHLVTAALEVLERSFAAAHGLTLTFTNAAEQKQHQDRVARLRSGQVLAQTARAERPFAFTVSIKDQARGTGCLVYLYDAAGEDIQAGSAAGEGVSGHDFHGFMDGLLLVVDPFAEEGLRREVEGSTPGGLPPGLNPAPRDAYYVLGRMIPFWGRSQRVSSEGRFVFPVAVALTKMDACGLADRVGGYAELDRIYRSFDGVAKDAEALSGRLRSLLQPAGSVDLLRLIDSHFRNASFFAVSSLGRSAEAKNSSPFQSRGAFAPVAWLLYRTGALSPTHPVLRSIGFFARQFSRCLRGAEGPRARLVAAGSFVTIAFTLLLLSWWLLGGCFATAVAIALLAFWLYVMTR